MQLPAHSEDRPPARTTTLGPEGHVSEPAPELERYALIGRYLVLDRIGIGGMSVVYAAYDPELERKVAIKLLRSKRTRRRRAQRHLVREAQALARLTHPNVITVYDVGTFEGRVFLAMELVEGFTLTQWRQQERPSWRHLLDVFREAGRGLAAAHAVGLVHRDFKPSNVMVGREGRVRVLDFGLARPFDETTTGSSTGSVSVSSDSGSYHHTGDDAATHASSKATADPSALPYSVGERPESSLAQRRRNVPPLLKPDDLTESDMALGTPAYMAPEQYSGNYEIDARSDQFSFCVALYEALYDQLPFDGEDAQAIFEQARQGRIRPAPPGKRVPGWLRRLVLRGLAYHPDHRWPSMDLLLAALARNRIDPRYNWRPAVAGGALVLTLFGGLSLNLTADSPCSNPERYWQSIWDNERQRQLEQGFLTTDAGYAADMWTETRQMIDAYIDDWSQTRVETCQATRRGEQSEDLLDQRMLCLDRRRREAGALLDLLAKPDRIVVRQAVEMTGGLTPVSSCTAASVMAGPQPPPDVLVPDVASLEGRLAEVRTLRLAGRGREALAVAENLVPDAFRLGHQPLMAEAYWYLGEMQRREDQPVLARANLTEALYFADLSHHETLRAEARLSLARLAADRGRALEGWQELRLADAVLQRLGQPPELELERLHTAVQLHMADRHPQAAMAFATQAVSASEKLYGPVHPAVAEALAELAETQENAGNIAAAIATLDRLLTVRRDLYGDDHPQVEETEQRLHGSSISRVPPAEASGATS